MRPSSPSPRALRSTGFPSGGATVAPSARSALRRLLTVEGASPQASAISLWLMVPAWAAMYSSTAAVILLRIATRPNP